MWSEKNSIANNVTFIVGNLYETFIVVLSLEILYGVPMWNRKELYSAHSYEVRLPIDSQQNLVLFLFCCSYIYIYIWESNPIHILT